MPQLAEILVPRRASRLSTVSGTRRMHDGMAERRAGERRGRPGQELAEAIAALHSLGSQRETAYVNGLMADVLAWAGRQSEAIRLLDETLLVSARTGAAAFDARIRGRKATVLATGSGADVAAAEAEFKYAIDIARNQSSKLFELQSCIGLARLWLRQGRPAEARGLLEPVHAWFTEGLTLPDLREAREVLAL